MNRELSRIEPAGDKALVIYQNWLDADGAQLILDWAKQGVRKPASKACATCQQRQEENPRASAGRS